MLLVIARLIVAKLLTDARVKQAVIDELKDLARDTETDWDDAAVARIEQAWDPLVGVLASRVK